MYNYIKGKLIESGENYVVVESGNIGYELNVSANTAAELSAADVTALSKTKGVGKKTAERIVLELKDKVNKDYTSEETVSAVKADVTEVDEEAVLALMTLGYNRHGASEAVKRVQKDGMSLEQLIFTALKNA